jgi:hypothetical protein
MVPGKTPELTAFLKAGRPRRDLTGAPVTGRVEARFDCGYFVSITVGGLQFGGVLYCPTGTGGSAQQANRGGGGGGVKREESAAGDTAAAAAAGGGGGGRKVAGGAGGSSKREAGAAGFEEGGGKGAKRRRSLREANDPSLANKPKSAKVGGAAVVLCGFWGLTGLCHHSLCQHRNLVTHRVKVRVGTGPKSAKVGGAAVVLWGWGEGYRGCAAMLWAVVWGLQAAVLL